jgi:alpha-D-xyloside xylohydrolase
MYCDPTNPEARQYVWDKIKPNYYDKGIKIYWLDDSEPDLDPMDHENLRFHAGNGAAVANLYPLLNARTFYDGLRAQGETEILTLSRSGWAGIQRYGAAIWSGDIPSTFASLREQVRAGLNMALSGIPWWTTDIGGFTDGDPRTPEFRELIVRWFQYGVFCPLFRLHGVRQPMHEKELTGAANEVWTFGEPATTIIAEQLRLRERLRPYLMQQMRVAHETGLPVMRPLFVDFPDCETIEDQFLFGPDILVAPVTEAGARSRSVRLPAGARWRDAWTGAIHDGGQTIVADAPLERIPVFLRDSANISTLASTFHENQPA